MSETFKLSSIGNIGHFLHENLYYAIVKYLDNPDVVWILDTKLNEWEKGISLMCANHLNIPIQYETILGHRSELPYNIGAHPHFHRIMSMIQTIVQQEYPDVSYDPNYKVLYFRNDTSARKMENYNGDIDHCFNEIVSDFSTMSFSDQVKLFMKCSHFVTIEGATLTNIIFMNKSAKIINISPTNNSWQLMFGTYQCVSEFNRLILNLPNFYVPTIMYTKTIENYILSKLDV